MQDSPNRRSTHLADKKQQPSRSTPGPAPSEGPSAPTSTVETARAKLQILAKDSIEFRLLDALLTHAPTLEGSGVIATDIVAVSAEPDGLNQLAEFYKKGFLLPSKPPAVSNSSCIAFSISVAG